MKTLIAPFLALSLALPGMAMAKENPGKGHGHPHIQTAPGHAASCPPGLAKKTPACVPPGLAKQVMPQVGDHLDGAHFGTRYILIRDPGRYGLDPYGTYYRVDGQVIQVNRETQEVLALIGAVSAILN